MPDLASVTWPPAPISTPRLVLRASEAHDRDSVIELFASPEVGTYIGGPQPRDRLEEVVPEVPGDRPGFFVVEWNAVTIGTVTLDQRDGARTPRVRPEGGELELGYLFLPGTWGHGYAAEASAAVLDWVAHELPGEPVVLTTQVANAAALRVAEKLGFTEVERFEEWGAEQWFGVWSSATASGSESGA